MVTCLASTVLAAVVSTSEPTATDREPSNASMTGSPAQASAQSAVGSGKRSLDQEVSERPVCSGRYLEADPTLDEGMVRRSDAAVDPAIVRRPACEVEQRGSSNGRGVRGPGSERRFRPTLSVPRGHSAEQSDPDPATEKPEP